MDHTFSFSSVKNTQMRKALKSVVSVFSSYLSKMQKWFRFQFSFSCQISTHRTGSRHYIEGILHFLLYILNLPHIPQITTNSQSVLAKLTQDTDPHVFVTRTEKCQEESRTKEPDTEADYKR